MKLNASHEQSEGSENPVGNEMSSCAIASVISLGVWDSRFSSWKSTYTEHHNIATGQSNRENLELAS